RTCTRHLQFLVHHASSLESLSHGEPRSGFLHALVPELCRQQRPRRLHQTRFRCHCGSHSTPCSCYNCCSSSNCAKCCLHCIDLQYESAAEWAIQRLPRVCCHSLGSTWTLIGGPSDFILLFLGFFVAEKVAGFRERVVIGSQRS